MKFPRIVPARRTENIKYAVRDVVALAQEVAATGKSMCYLNIGDPNLFDFQTPAHIVEAVHQAMKANKNGYAPSSGIKNALASINAQAASQGIESIQHTFVTTGASEAIDLALTALVNEGENVLTPSPVYPLYTAILSKIDGVNNPYYLDEANNWEPDIADIASKINDKSRAIILLSPNNPTGTVYSQETLRAVLDLAIKHNLVIFSDEIYDKLLLDDMPYTSTASLSQDVPVVTFNGMSKAYLAPGFRIGWGIVSGPAGVVGDYCEAIQKLERARLSANHPEQYAISAALDGDHAFLEPVLKKLRSRRDLTVERLNAIDGISCVPPQAAFYAFPRLDLGIDDETFVQKLVRETGTVCVHGSGFGQRPGTQHFRVVFLAPEDTLNRAFDNIEAIARTYR
ncbi:MAG: aminotransferase class I/II-fold pyridoxal phosphate-dependent enzyme [Planctomycetes bacterium]|nr:aminotransferase class I/II-fold pyridoxal phosphate-dependent enzyme [Planctomycetota bacterium]